MKHRKSMMIETKIYVGLNDSVTKTQIHDTGTYVEILRKVCLAYQTPFSFDVQEGGYIHENGEYTNEKTLVLTLIDADKKTVDEIAKDLCVFFNQESVLITEDFIRAYQIRESLEPES